jgi:hypothetical protein
VKVRERAVRAEPLFFFNVSARDRILRFFHLGRLVPQPQFCDREDVRFQGNQFPLAGGAETSVIRTSSMSQQVLNVGRRPYLHGIRGSVHVHCAMGITVASEKS